jgi:hypothetical protein
MPQKVWTKRSVIENQFQIDHRAFCLMQLTQDVQKQSTIEQ